MPSHCYWGSVCIVTSWTAAYQASLSMGFSRQEYWSGFPFPSPGDLPDPGIKPMPLAVEALSLNLWTTREFPTCAFNQSLEQGQTSLLDILLAWWTHFLLIHSVTDGIDPKRAPFIYCIPPSILEKQGFVSSPFVTSRRARELSPVFTTSVFHSFFILALRNSPL